MYAKFHACRQICTIFPFRAWTKKDELVAEDTYVFSFAAINGRPVKRLNKLLKPELDVTMSKDDDTKFMIIIQSVIELCIQLQEKVKNLESKIKLQEERMKTLETEHTKHKMHNMNAPSYRSGDQAEEECLTSLTRLIQVPSRLLRSLVMIVSLGNCILSLKLKLLEDRPMMESLSNPLTFHPGVRLLPHTRLLSLLARSMVQYL